MRALPDGTRVLPWASWSEWLELKDMLTAGELEEAKARVALYQVRRRGSVPISVLSSVALAYQLKNPSPDPYTQRLSLSMTITRLVNGLTDRIQPRGQSANARSVHGLAVELGLPLTLVDIRHQSCHNLLPRLAALESGARHALFWLEQFYWKPQHKNLIYKLPKSFLELKHVFDIGPEQETENQGLDQASFLSNGLISEDDDVDPVVLKMKEITKRLEERRKQSVRPVPISKNRSSGKRWRKCENSNSWKPLALGLIPGQTRPPRLKRINACGEFSPQLRQDQSDAPHDMNVSSIGHDLPVRANNEEPPSKRSRGLTKEEVEKIASLTNHFRSLVSDQVPAKF